MNAATELLAHKLETVRSTEKKFQVEFVDSVTARIASGRGMTRKQGDLLERLFEGAKAEQASASLPKVSPDSAHIGAVGERLRGLRLTLIGYRVFEGHFGLSCMHRFVDESGNEFVTFTGLKLAELGDVVTATGTVKEHAEWNGRKSTKLSRVKIA